MLSFLKKDELNRIYDLELKMNLLQEENERLRNENKEIKSLELKVQIMELHINGDQSIDEILKCYKENKLRDQRDGLRMMEGIRNMGMSQVLGLQGNSLFDGIFGQTKPLD